MRYKALGLTIRSENAAKPVSQISKRVVAWLRCNVKCEQALDYGCGRLRYAPALLKIARCVTFVDSAAQLNRDQLLFGKRTTVRSIVQRRWKRATVLDLEQFAQERKFYDFVLCANVLSAIPNRSVRSDVVRILSSRLTPKGRCLFVTQHRNSDFSRMSNLPTARKYLDGWILRSNRGASYYGILDRVKLLSLVRRHGHRVVDAWISGESTFVLTCRHA
jgi:2-polyprenyl-3-methyl-5-hydroxy-6-metoxy-1,4-benzoquinol methylase